MPAYSQRFYVVSPEPVPFLRPSSQFQVNSPLKLLYWIASDPWAANLVGEQTQTTRPEITSCLPEELEAVRRSRKTSRRRKRKPRSRTRRSILFVGLTTHSLHTVLRQASVQEIRESPPGRIPFPAMPAVPLREVVQPIRKVTAADHS